MGVFGYECDKKLDGKQKENHEIVTRITDSLFDFCIIHDFDMKVSYITVEVTTLRYAFQTTHVFSKGYLNYYSAKLADIDT